MSQEQPGHGIELKPTPAVMSMTLEITRAATGKTETIEIVCTPITNPKEQENGRDPLDRIS